MLWFKHTLVAVKGLKQVIVERMASVDVIYGTQSVEKYGVTSVKQVRPKTFTLSDQIEPKEAKLCGLFSNPLC